MNEAKHPGFAVYPPADANFEHATAQPALWPPIVIKRPEPGSDSEHGWIIVVVIGLVALINWFRKTLFWDC